MTRTKIRILIADDHAVVRAGLTAILSAADDLEVVAEAVDGIDAAKQYRKLKPDVLVSDLRMPGMDGVELVADVRAVDPRARVILLTTFDDEESITHGLEAGAAGYLLKDAAATELADAVRKVHQGRKVLSPHAAERLADRMTASELTQREREVLELVAAGNSNKQIAKALTISSGTVKVHVANVLAKLDSQSRSEAVAVAARRGLIRFN